MLRKGENNKQDDFVGHSSFFFSNIDLFQFLKNKLTNEFK